MESDDGFLRALSAHDAAVSQLGLPIWIGAEPTFTDRFSEAPEWLFCALGDDKRERAERVFARLASASPGSAVFRCVGRQYEDEDLPRWNYGLYSHRQGRTTWKGPPDPLLVGSLENASGAGESPDPVKLDPVQYARLLADRLNQRCLSASVLPEPQAGRLVFRCDDVPLPTDIKQCPDLGRALLGQDRVEGVEVCDELARDGSYLICCVPSGDALQVELPAISDIELFARVLETIGETANELEIPAMMLTGFPPPIDDSIAWMTVTADPAVIEVNMAPANQISDLWRDLTQLQQAANAEGLDSFRLQYNGEESDSGGGGQITLGGPTPQASPFLRIPGMLPSLVRYFNRHPSLSYLHAFASIGPASQAPRVDEGVRGTMNELRLTLELLRRVGNPAPETIWGALAPFLADPGGNTHRAEINIEKLWNPYLGNRGRLGLVEFRSFRMGPVPETTTSLAALLRSIVAMLAAHHCDQPLVDWGGELHERYSLPFFLQADLREVLEDLNREGFGLGEPIVEHLMRDKDLLLSRFQLGNTQVELRRAMEFWPLVGDVSMQRGGSRTIDASTHRIEVRLRNNDNPESLDDWTLRYGDWEIPLRAVHDRVGDGRLVGLRYRSFCPQQGLHPTLPAQDPLTLVLSHPDDRHWEICLHQWEPNGQAYPGLPVDLQEARSRRQARCVVKQLHRAPDPGNPPPPEALGDHITDLRWY
ncbi:transglutaminase family protein [Roseiconus lacunae]|uniref:transglutaminase family protein n=1 Tax=Roseiconus lacunae TaxID=2605694 RepID=UPI0011F15085|nr:transglutaminase family protein [Roseiconus lacunae]